MLTALMALGLDMYLPAMPAMAEDLQVQASFLQWTVSAFLLGTAVGPLIAGPIADRFGRRILLLSCAAFFVLTSLLCARVSSVEELLALRLIQALAAGASFTVARAALSDLYAGNELARAFSFVMLIMSVGPLIAPAVGSELLAAFGWRSIFVALAVFGAMTFALTFFGLPETLKAEDRRSINPAVVLKGYWEIVSDLRGMAYALVAGLMSAAYFAALAALSFIFIDYYGASPRLFAILFATMGLAAAMSNLINARLLAKFSFITVLFWLLGLAAVDASVLLFNSITGFGGMWGIYACVVFFMGFFQTISNNALAGFLTAFRDRAGTASGVFSSFRFVSGVIGSAVVGALNNGLPWPFGAVAFTSIALAAVIGFTAFRKNESR